MRIFSCKQSRPILTILSKERKYRKDIQIHRKLENHAWKLEYKGARWTQVTPQEVWTFTSTPLTRMLTSYIPLCLPLVAIQSPGSECLIGWAYHGWAEEESGPLNFSEMGIAFSLRLATMVNSPKRVIQMLMEEGAGEEGLDNGCQKINK